MGMGAGSTPSADFCPAVGLPLDPGRGSVTYCKSAAARQSRDRKGAYSARGPNPQNCQASGASQPKANLALLVTLTSMAKLIFGLQQSLDGYVDHLEMRPGPALSRHFLEH